MSFRMAGVLIGLLATSVSAQDASFELPPDVEVAPPEPTTSAEVNGIFLAPDDAIVPAALPAETFNVFERDAGVPLDAETATMWSNVPGVDEPPKSGDA